MDKIIDDITMQVIIAYRGRQKPTNRRIREIIRKGIERAIKEIKNATTDRTAR